MLLFFFMGSFFKIDAQESVGYSVQEQLPANQIDPALSYFNLRIEPSQTQELSITIYNHENEEITVHGDVYNASTNHNGVLVYEPQEEIAPSLEQPVTEFIRFEEDEWTIPAGESLTVTAVMETPSEPFDGVKLGGFHFEKVIDNRESEDGVSIQNRYAYVIGVQVSVNEEGVDPQLELHTIEPQLVNHRTAVVAAIENKQPTIIGDLTIQARVFEEDASAPLRELEQTGIKMAPNSVIDFAVDWDGKRLEEGKYRMELTATDGNQIWEWEEAFSIDEEVEEINENAVDIESSEVTSNWYIYGIGLLVVLVVLLLLYILRLKKGNQKNE